MSEDSMTPAQRETMQKAYTMLGEHFDFVVISVGFDSKDSSSQCSESYWKGGWIPAIGLMENAKHGIVSKKRDSDPSDE